MGAKHGEGHVDQWYEDVEDVALFVFGEGDVSAVSVPGLSWVAGRAHQEGQVDQAVLFGRLYLVRLNQFVAGVVNVVCSCCNNSIVES